MLLLGDIIYLSSLTSPKGASVHALDALHCTISVHTLVGAYSAEPDLIDEASRGASV